MTGVPPPPGLVWEDESPAPAGGPRPSLGQPPAGLVWEDELQAAPGPSQPVAPPAGPPSPTGVLPPAGLPPPAGGSALRPGSLQPQVIQPGNPLREAMLGRQREAGGAPLASLGPEEIQAAGAAAAPPMPEIPLPGLSGAGQQLKAAGVSAAQGTPGLIAGAARFVPETAMRLRRGVTDEMADAIGATEVQREILHDATKRMMKSTPFFAAEFQAEKLKKLDDAVMRPAEKFWEDTPTAKRIQEKRSTQSTGEALLDPQRWASAIGGAAPSLVAMGLTGGGSTAMGTLPMFMEGGGKLREEEDRERRTGEKPKDLAVATVAMVTGVVNGALERWGFENAVGHLADFLPKEARRGFLSVVAKGIQGALGEGGTEVLQQLLPNVLTKALIDSSQDLGEGVLDALMGGIGAGGGMGSVSQASRVDKVDSRKTRMDDRRAWRAEEGPSTPPSPAPFAEGGPGRGTVPQAELDAINEGVRSLEKPLSPDQKLERLKAQSAALDAQVRRLQSEVGLPTHDPSMQAPAPAEAPLPAQPPHRPISVDQLLGAQALRDVVKETDFRDQTADARGRNVLNAANAEERQRIAETPGAALRLILGDDPAFAPTPAPAPVAPAATPLETTSAPSAEKRMASTPVLDWLDTRSQEVDEDRRTLPPEEWGHDEARYFALTDAKTGLPNRLAYDVASRQDPDADVLGVDLDGLKAANDSFGHDVGDQYIEMLALEARRNGVRLFRTGGDEFQTLGAEEELRPLIEATRQGLQGKKIPVEGKTPAEYPVHKGFSYGFGRDEKSADVALYADKRARKSGSPSRSGQADQPERDGVGGSTGPEAPAGPGDSRGVPPPLRRPGGDDSGSSGAPPAGPASLPPPVTPAAPAAAAASAPNPEPTTEAFTRKGKTGEAFTADGERVGTQWAIADAFDELVPSHTENGAGDLEPNPAFARVLQPRNRERVASQDQIGEMAKSLRPGALGESFNASDGAPIVGPDRLVESGNGRTLALRRAFRTGKGEAYRAWLEEHAADFGMTPEDVRAVKNPVLVRVRTTPTSDRAELVKKFNVATVATMSASETAAADADRLTPEMLARFEPGGDGNAILSMRNRDFVEKFFSSVPANERGRLIDSKGELSQDGVRRIQNALMAKAYGSSPVLERLAESTDDNIKTVSTALSNAAPGMAAVKAGIAKGDILPLDPAPAIIEAAEKLSYLRDKGTKVSDFLDQGGLFGDEMTAEGREFLRTFEEHKRSGKKLSEVLTFLADSLITDGGAKQETLFDDSPAPRLEDFIRAARRAVSDRGQVSLFGGETDLRTDGPEGDRPGPLPPGGRSGSVDKPRVSLTQGLKSTPPTPRHVMLIERYARSMSASWKDAPRIVVVSTEAELPEAIRERAESFDATGGVDGVYMGAKDDRVFLVASRLNSREDVERVVLHEVMGHAGLRRILDRATFASVMDQIAESLPKDVEAKARAYGLNLKDVGERREAADEVLAEWASRPEAAPRAITRAMVAIRGWLRQHFPNLKWTEADVRSLLAKARTRIENGAGTEEQKSESAPRFSRTVDEGPAEDHLGDDVREQLSLFSPEQLNERAEQALADLGGDRGSVDLVGGRARGLEGAGIRTRADAFAGIIRRRGGIDFRGIEVKDAEDLAVAARVVHDPRLETLRIFYVKGDRIVGHEAWSSRLPASVDFRSGRIEKLSDDLQRRMFRFGADGYYLLHNHPSGDPSPSTADEAFAKHVAAKVPGMLASVVIDHNRYGLITNQKTKSGVWKSLVLNVAKENVIHEDRATEEGLYDRITNSGELAAAGKRFHEGRDTVTVFYQDAKLRVTGIQDVPVGRLTGKGAISFFRGQFRNFGASGMAAYFPIRKDTGAKSQWELARSLRPLFAQGMLHEAMGENFPGVVAEGLSARGAFAGPNLGLSTQQQAARRVAEAEDTFERGPSFSRTSSSAEDRIYDSMMARARSRAAAAAETAKRVQAELEDPGDVMEARRDPNLPAHSSEIQNHIRPAGSRETIKGLLNPLEARYQELIRRHFAIEKASAQMGSGTGPAHADPGVVAELAAGHSARAEQMLAGNGGFRNGKDGGIEWTGNRSLLSILQDLGPGRLNELRRYLVARRAIELHHRSSRQGELLGMKEETIFSGIGEAVAQREVAGAPADIKKAAEKVTALLDDALRYWADAGGLSAGAVDVIRDMNRAYVPFYRIFEGGKTGKTGKLVLPAKRGTALQSEQAVKKIMGSGRDVLDPLVAVADHVQRMIRAADLNRVGKTLVEAAALHPEQAVGLVEEVQASRPTDGVTNEGRAVQDAAADFGVEVGDEAASALSFLSDKKLTYADDRIKVWQNGKLKEYRVAKEIGESLRALGPEDVKFFGKAVAFPAKLLRGGVTKNPIFQLHNFLRDTADAGVQSRNGFIPILDSIRGFKESIRDGSLRREWLAAGGGFATLSGGGLKGAEKTIRDIAPRTRTQSVLKTVIHPLEALSVFGRPFEEAARLGEFRKARLAGKSATEAALDAARVTTNFTVHGADATFWWLAKASAFTNPAIQGADKAFRTILEAPRGETQSAGRIGRAAAAVAIRGLVNVSVLSAVLYALNYDDDEIEELRKTKAGAVWWFVRVPGTKTILRMPKPFLWGQMFGTGMETLLDQARGVNPDGLKRWRDEVLEMLTDNVFPIPTSAKVANALTYNFDPFFKRPVVPRGLEGAEPEMQVTPRTGETARQVGKLTRDLPDVTGTGWIKSPAKLEHAVGGIGGTLGREALKVSDSFLRDPGSSPPERHLSELPLVGRAFATGGTTGTYSIERFWREMDDVRKAKTTLREKMKSDPKGARAYAKEKAKQLGAFSTYEATSERLGDLRKSIEAVRKAPDSRFTPAEKTRRIDALQARMNDVAKRTIERNLLEEKRP